MKKDYTQTIALFLIFATIAVVLWLWSGSIFFLFNFLYIGSFLSLGIFLTINGYKHSRLIVQLGVGLYMLVFLGLLQRENMQLEGFFYFLFLGVFQAAVIHYTVAKIAGPLVFGRGWCGYACWTAMVLDFLPYKVPEKPRVVKLEKIRYLMFVLSLSFVAALFLFKPANLEMIMFISFIAGNLIYYAVGIWLAYRFKDNRAFCKYVCPITMFLKPACYFSITRIKVDESKCIHCGKCLKVCPMNVDMLNNSRRRKNGTECILCMACIKVCPKSALKM